MCLFLCRDLLSPLLPACLYLLDLLFINHRVHGCDVSGDRAGISQARDRSTIQSRNRHNETVMYLLWTCGNSASAGSLLQRNSGHDHIWTEVQSALGSQKCGTIEQG